MRDYFIVHVYGNRPHHVDFWTKAYKNQPTAAGQATRWVTGRDNRYGRSDWRAVIYHLHWTDDGPKLTPVQEVTS